MTKHALAKVLAIAIVALPVTACGSTSSTSSSTAANDASGRSSLGAAHRASGEPIQVAMISQETGPNAIPDEREAAQVAVKYVNTYLGGINGRPLKLAFCATDGSPEASSSCANQLLARHPVAFVGNLDQGTSGSGPIIERAGVPLFGTAAITPDAAGATNSYALGLVGLNDLAGWVKYAVTGLKAKRINFMVIQLPGASINNTVWQQVTRANGGVPGKAVEVPPTATDMSSYVAAASAGDPDAIVGATSPGQCVPIMKLHSTVAPTIPLVFGASCAGRKVLDAAGSAANGVHFGWSFHNPYDTADQQVGTFRSALAQLGGSNVSLSEFAVNGFAAIVDLRTILHGVTDITAASVRDAIEHAKGAPGFMSGPLTCGRGAAFSPGECATGVWPTQVKDGEVVNAGTTWFDGSGDVKLR